MNFKIIMFFLLLLSTVLQSSHHVQTTRGISPSFVRQEIIGSPNDWNLWKGDSSISIIKLHNGNNITIKNADKISQCKKSNNEFISPAIDSASYTSDGKKFNATVWFTKPFVEPSTNDTVDTYQENLQIKSKNLSSSDTHDLGQEANRVMAEINNPQTISNFTPLEKSVTKIDNNNAYKLVYSAINSDGVLLKNMTLLTIKSNKLYYITFSALNNTYNSFFPKIHRAISSIKFINSSTNNITNLQDKQNKNHSNKRDNYSNSNREFNLSQLNNIKTQSYEFIDMGIGITPPYGWTKEDIQESDKNNLIIFKSPFSDEKSKELSYHETTITMALAIDSLQHDRVTDYRVMYSKEKDTNNNNNTHWHWVTKFMEVSANDKERIIEKSNSSDFFDKKNQNPPPGYTLFSLDLDKINYPQQYRVLFYITDYFVLSHLYCRLVDTTNWVMIPPPLFEISTKPSSLTLRPGENSNIEVTIKGNVDLPTQVYYLSNHTDNKINYVNEQDKKNNEIKINYIQNKISIPPSGIGTSNLNIKVPDGFGAENKESITIPVSAKIYFPSKITNRGGESFSNSNNQSITSMSNLTLTVLPPYTPGELVNNFVGTWITPISGIWSFFAGVAAVLTPAIIKFYKKKNGHREYY